MAAISKNFPRTARILKHATFENVYQNGKKVFSQQMILFYMLRVSEQCLPGVVAAAGPRVGLTVGKKLGGAVERNRIKRRMRAAVASALNELGGDLAVDVVINARKTVLQSDFAALQHEVRKAFVTVRANLRNMRAK